MLAYRNCAIVYVIIFVWFNGVSTQFRSYGTETGKMILANLGCKKLKATPGVKTTSPAGAER
jgi:hypothetical protein